jgi:DNA-binding NarL/FixJ family response regulator
MSKVYGQDDENNGRPETRPAAQNMPTNQEFVRIVYPYPMITAGLARALEKAGIRYGAEPPLGGAPHHVVLWVDAGQDLPEAVARVRETSPKASILVFTLRNDLPLAQSALETGARGFIHTGMTPEQIVRALSVVSTGEIVAPRELLEFLLTNEDSPANLEDVPERQRAILDLLAEGLTNAQIAKRLYLAESTVKQHLRAAYKLLGVKNALKPRSSCAAAGSREPSLNQASADRPDGLSLRRGVAIVPSYRFTLHIHP